MIALSRFRFGLITLAILVPVALLLFSQPGPAAAQPCTDLFAGLKDPGCSPTVRLLEGLRYEHNAQMCWASGPLPDVDPRYKVAWPDFGLVRGKGGFGSEKDFILDPRDFWTSVDQQARPLALRVAGSNRDGAFADFPSSVDLNYFVDRHDLHSFYNLRPQPDNRYVWLYGLLNGTSNSKLPYEDAREYMARRVVADPHDRRIRHFKTSWEDASAGPSGSDVNQAALASDVVASHSEAARTHTVSAESGSRLITGVAQQDLIANKGVLNLNCPSGNPCTVTFTSDASTVTGQVVSSMVDQNHFERFNTDPINTQFEMNDEDNNPVLLTRDGKNFTGYLDSRFDKPETAYRDVLMADTGHNNLIVELELDPSYRSDTEADFYERYSEDLAPIRAFGLSTWSYPYFLGQLPFLGTDASDVENIGTNVPVYEYAHSGFRQPTLVSPYGDFWDFGLTSDYYDNLPTGSAKVAPTPSADYAESDRIRWPANLQDMNWYLYQLPGDLAEVESSAAAFWHTPIGRDAVVHSAYATTHIPYLSFFSDIDCGFLDPRDIDADSDFLEGPVALNSALCSKEPLITDHVDVDRIKVSDGPGFYPFITVNGLSHMESTGVPAAISAGTAQPTLGLDFMAQYMAQKGYDDRSDDSVMEYWAVPVRAGTAAASDWNDASRARKLDEFGFTVRESQRVVNEGGELSDSRLGLPSFEPSRAAVEARWPMGDLNPNHAHLMVVTFYESLPVEANDYYNDLSYIFSAFTYEGTVDYLLDADAPEYDEDLADLVEEYLFQCSGTRDVNDIACVTAKSHLSKRGIEPERLADLQIQDSVVEIPRRYVRRVICRLFVGTAGHTETQWSFSDPVVDFFADTARTIAGIYDAITTWYSSLTTTLGEGPVRLGEEATAFVCDGAAHLHELTSDGSAADASYSVGADGALVHSSSGESRREHIELCTRLSVPDEVQCMSVSDALLTDGSCVNMPQMSLIYSLNPSDFTFFDPETLTGVHPGRPIKLRPGTTPPRYLVEWAGSVDGLDASNLPRGSTEPVGFAAFDDETSSLLSKGLTRVHVKFDFAWPSARQNLYESVRGYMVAVRPDPKVFGPQGAYWRPFLLPSLVTEYGSRPDPLNRGSTVPFRNHHRVDGFYFGDLGANPDKGLPGAGDFYPRHQDYGGIRAVGPPKVQTDLNEFHVLLSQLPVAPGFQHDFRIIPYLDTPDQDRWVMGRHMSNTFTVNGDRAACWADALPPEVHDWYGCDEFVPTPAEAGPGEGFRLGLLGLASSDVCGDIFSATPPHFTWDNPYVKRVWSFSWMIAGTIFFVLLVWQGFRMTYDMWLNPRPAIGFRELIPRYILALVLALGSLYLSKWVLILSHDLTCFVAQTTGMDMWGVIKNTFLVLAEGFFGVFDVLLGSQAHVQSPGEAIRNLLIVLAVGFVVLVVLVIILYLFCMLAFKMLMRLALLAICIALAPIAFAFLASDSTEHWTRKWISIFLGAAFQQAVILIVVYLGANMIDFYLEGNNGAFGVFIISSILAMLVLSMANYVPKLVNPAGEGVFDSFGSLARMGGAAALMAVTAGAGAAVGAARGPGGGIIGSVPLGGPGGAPGGGGAPGAPGAAPGPGAGGLGGVGGAAGGAAPAAGGVTGVVGGPVGVAAGTVAGSVFGGLATAGRFATGAARHVGLGAMQGAQSGARMGGGFNTQAQDIARGNVWYRHMSSGDDSARQMESMRLAVQTLNRQRSPGSP